MAYEEKKTQEARAPTPPADDAPLPPPPPVPVPELPAPPPPMVEAAFPAAHSPF